MGTGFGWLSPMIQRLLEDPTSEIKPTIEECSWIASLSDFGRTFGPIFSILLLDILGRKCMVQMGAATFLILWSAILFTRSILILCLARFVFGLSVGTCDAISSVYIGENCSPRIRGIFCSATLTCFYLGVLLGYALSTYLAYDTIAMICLGIVVLCLLSTFLLVESPQFLMLKGRYEKAEKNLMWLNGTTDSNDVNNEYEKIKLNIDSEKAKKTSYIKLITLPTNYKSLVVVLLLNVSHAASGSSVLFSYVSIIFPSTEFLSSNEFTICFGIIQLLSALSSSLVIEKYNRRTLTLISFAVFTVCHAIIALLYYTNENIAPIKYSPGIIFFLICLYASFSAVMDSVVHMIRGELFAQSIKPLGSGLSLMIYSFTSFVIVKIFLLMRGHFGIYINFILYAVASLLAFWCNYFYLPETRGKTLIDIQKALEKQI